MGKKRGRARRERRLPPGFGVPPPYGDWGGSYRQPGRNNHSDDVDSSSSDYDTEEEDRARSLGMTGGVTREGTG